MNRMLLRGRTLFKLAIFLFILSSLFSDLSNTKSSTISPPSFDPKPCPIARTLPSAIPCCLDRGIFSLSFLFWQGKLWGLEFATKSLTYNDPNASMQTFTQKLFVPDFAWRPGVKVILGAYLPIDHCELLGGYTYYHEECTSLKKHFHSLISPEGFGIIPLWHYPFLQISATNTNPLRYGSAAANWRMDFNSFDLEIGRSFLPNPLLPMKLKIGIKGAYISQFYHADYANGTTVLALAPESATSSFYQFVSSRFQAATEQWGIGPKMGFESRWNIYQGFHFIGHAATSILCSFFNLKSSYDNIITPTIENAKQQMKEDFHELTPVLEAMFGLDWGVCLNPLFFEFTVGYEWQYWWWINHARRSYTQSAPGTTFDTRGDLQMQGLNASIQFSF